MGRTILEIFEEIPEPRKGNGIRHKLIDVISIGILATLCDFTAYTEMELYAQEKEGWLRTFLELPNGIPSHDTIGDIFAAISSNALHRCFAEWVETIREAISGEIVAVDGKTLRRSKDKQKGLKPLHVVSAWANQNRLVLGEIATEEKSNEITAIPALLKLLNIKGCIVTIDAMGTQKEIAKTIIKEGGDYVLALKENHRDFYEDVQLYFKEEILPQNKLDLEKDGRYAKATEKSHGRYETRECYLSSEIDWLENRKDWEKLRGIGLIISTRQIAGELEISTNMHYFIYSADMSAQSLLHAKRSHWGIENSLHWSLDMLLREDESRVRTGNAAENLNVLRHLALNLVRNETSVKSSMRLKLKRCSLSNDYLLKVLGVTVW